MNDFADRLVETGEFVSSQALPRYAAASAHLHEKAGDPARAARPTLAERHHLTLQAARLAPFR